MLAIPKWFTWAAPVTLKLLSLLPGPHRIKLDFQNQLGHELGTWIEQLSWLANGATRINFDILRGVQVDLRRRPASTSLDHESEVKHAPIVTDRGFSLGQLFVEGYRLNYLVEIITKSFGIGTKSHRFVANLENYR